MLEARARSERSARSCCASAAVSTLSAIDTAATPGFDGGKTAGVQALAAARDESSPSGRSCCSRTASRATGGSVLLVLQAMDTAGKGGIVKHVVGSVDPQGVHIAAFKAPTRRGEAARLPLAHPQRSCRRAGMIGVFDRSHYEDVLIHRVRELSPPEVIEERYAQIVDFERELVADEDHDREGHAAHLARGAEGRG